MHAARPPLTPNQITTLRIVTFIAGSVALVGRHLDVALGLLFLGGVMDRLDGWVARKYGMASEFGKIYDQLGDKLASLVVLTALVQIDVLPAWFFGAILFRDLVMSGLRDYLLIARQRVLGASWLGKRKTDVHWISLLALLLAFRFDWHFDAVRAAGIAASLLMSYGSLAAYLLEARRVAEA
jgi:CDP-diacylglycerol--glycerol-3-phosphate 3-phosphatidyltransferase